MLQDHVSKITPEQVRQIGDAMAENGRVLATLDDWRAMLFIASGLIIVLAGLVLAVIRANRTERKDMAAERERMWGVADKFGDAAGKLTAQLQVTQALNARVESALGQTETILQEVKDRPRGRRT